MTPQQLKILDRYFTAKMFEMIASNNGRGATLNALPQASKARTRAFSKVLDVFDISYEHWEAEITSND